MKGRFSKLVKRIIRFSSIYDKYPKTEYGLELIDDDLTYVWDKQVDIYLKMIVDTILSKGSGKLLSINKVDPKDHNLNIYAEGNFIYKNNKYSIHVECYDLNKHHGIEVTIKNEDEDRIVIDKALDANYSYDHHNYVISPSDISNVGNLFIRKIL